MAGPFVLAPYPPVFICAMSNFAYSPVKNNVAVAAKGQTTGGTYG